MLALRLVAVAGGRKNRGEKRRGGPNAHHRRTGRGLHISRQSLVNKVFESAANEPGTSRAVTRTRREDSMVRRSTTAMACAALAACIGCGGANDRKDATTAAVERQSDRSGAESQT